MVFARASTLATRSAASLAARSAPQRQQQRGMIEWLVNWPDKVMEKKAIQMKGGTMQGEANPTWMKQPGDMAVAMFALGTTAFATALLVRAHVIMAFGWDKKAD